MTENNIDIKNAIELAKTIKEVAPNTMEQVDDIVSSIVGLFNNVVLYPIKKANIDFKYKLIDFENELKEKVKNIPLEYRKNPQLNISGPALESLRYNIDIHDLRTMYINLLTSAIDIRKNNIVHPSYINIIRQMNEYDVHLFHFLYNVKGLIKAINPSVHIVGTNKAYINSMPQWFINYFEKDYDIYETSASLCRLSNYGLIELMYDRTAGFDGYNELKQHKNLVKILEQYKKQFPEQQLDISATDSIVRINDYGIAFYKVCYLI